nr:AAA family ATPase [Syntrophobacteraceae bacterium]
HGSVTPRKIVERVRLGESLHENESPLMGIRVSDVLESFFRDIAPPRLESAAVLRKGIARGVSEGVFAYVSLPAIASGKAGGGDPPVGSDGKFQVNRDKVIFRRSLAEDEIDFDTGFLMMPEAIPAESPESQPSGATPLHGFTEIPAIHETPTWIGGESGAGPAVSETKGEVRNRVVMMFEATREQVFKAFPAIANLADKSDGGKVRLRVEGSSASGFDPSWLRNAVDEPLDEADIERTTEE